MVRARARTIPTPEKLGDAAKFLAEVSGLSEYDAVMLADLVMIDRSIANLKVLEARTGVRYDNFRLKEAALIKRMDGDPNSPLYWGKEGMESSAGRRCVLAPRHMLFLYLEYLRHGASQDYVSSAHCISQATASRYFEYVEQALSEMLPTADNMTARLQKARTEDQVQKVAGQALADFEEAAGAEPGSAGKPGKTLPGNVSSTDGVDIPKERPTDKVEQKECYSGKRKSHTSKVDMVTNSEGLALGMTELAPGSKHDLALLRESEPDLGLITRCVKGQSAAMVIVELFDKGFRGVESHHPGSVVKIPLPRKKSNTKKAKAYNRRVNSGRAIIENAFRRHKTFARMRNRVRAHQKEREEDVINVITGLVNLYILTGAGREPRTHRKGKKPGPKTARSR